MPGVRGSGEKGPAGKGDEGLSLYQPLPPLTEEEYGALLEDIRLHGVRVPIVQDEEGNVIDGHHRLKAVHALRAEGYAVELPKAEVLAGLSEPEKVLTAVDLNLHRRHLTDAQKVLIGKRIEEYVARANAERRAQAAGQPRGTKASSSHMDKGPGETPAPQPGEATRDAVARMVGLGAGKTYERAQTALGWVQAAAAGDAPPARVTEAADLLADVEAGTATMREVRRFANLVNPERRTRQGDKAGPQGRAMNIAVPLTRREYQSLMEWAWANPSREDLLVLADADVRLDIEIERAERIAAHLETDGMKGLAHAFRAALEEPKRLQDLADNEQAVIRATRRKQDGVVVVDVVRGTPTPRAEAGWEWGKGQQREGTNE